MSGRVLGAALPLLLVLLAACVAEEPAQAGDGDPTATPANPSATAAGAPTTPTPAGPLSDADAVALLERAVCWLDDPALAASCLPPGPGALDAIATMGASGDVRFVAPLIDMRSVEVGWERQVEDALEAITGERFDDPYGWYRFDYRAPATPGYPQWKAALLSITATDDTSPRFEELLRPFEPEAGTAAASLTSRLVWTMVQPNGIPPLTEPATVHRVEERYLDPADVVYGLQIGDEARAYPRRIVAWHGVVNDVLAGTPVLISHCLPCGGAGAFARSLDGEALTFGNAGLAYQGRTLIFDEQQLRLWDPVSAAALDPVAGQASDALQPLPLVTTTWGAWTAIHPNSTVLSLETGYVRDYDSEVAVADEQAADRPLYPALDQDALPQREPIIGMDLGVGALAEQRAYPVEDVETRGIVHDTLGGVAIVLLSRGPGLGARAYEAGGVAVGRLVVEGEDLIAIDVTGERWFANERALVSALDGREHPRLPLWQGYWFAWYGAHQESDVWFGGS